MATNKKLVEKERQLAELNAQITKYTAEHSVKTFKSEYIGCKNCESKLKRVLLPSEKCPVCGTDLRGQTTLDTLQKYQDKRNKLMRELSILHSACK